MNLPFDIQEWELSHFFIFLNEIKAGCMFHSVITPQHTHPPVSRCPVSSLVTTCSQSRNGEWSRSLYLSGLYFFSSIFSFKSHRSWASLKYWCSKQLRHTLLMLRTPHHAPQNLNTTCHPCCCFCFFHGPCVGSRYAHLKETTGLLFFLSPLSVVWPAPYSCPIAASLLHYL